MRSILILTILFCGIFKVESQIVNVESQRLKSDTVGWLGSVGTTFQLEKSAVQLININAEAHLEYKSAKSIYLFLVNYNLLKGQEQTFQNNLFYHLRYNYKVDKVLRWELFTQLQQNNVAGIRARFLLGTGPRFKISGTDKFVLYAATAAMYEYEKEVSKPVIVHNDIRNSSYVSFTWKPADNYVLVNTFFFQPLFNNISDYRILHELSLELKFIKNFSFITKWNYLFDSEPAADIPRQVYLIKNGLKYIF